MRLTSRRAARALVWDADAYVANKSSFQAQFAASYLDRGDPTLRERLCEARALLDVGSGDGSFTSVMASLMPTTSRVVGVDPSSAMVESARAASRARKVTGGAALAFENCDVASIAEWENEGYVPFKLNGFDLATSFMALHWCTEARIPATLRAIRSALDNRGDAWLIASFHGERSMSSLFAAIYATIDATAHGASAASWDDAATLVASERWRGRFPNGRADFVPITMLPTVTWRRNLADAGFDVVERGRISSRTVTTEYPDAAATAARLSAAFGPMFPTLPATSDREAFFEDVAHNAVRAASDSSCDPRPVVVVSRVVDVAVPVRR